MRHRRQPGVIRTGLIFYPEIVRMRVRGVLVPGNRRAAPCLGSGDMKSRFSALPVVGVPRLVDLQVAVGEAAGENRGPDPVEVARRHRPCYPLVNEAGTDMEGGAEEVEMPMMAQLKVRLAIIRAAR